MTITTDSALGTITEHTVAALSAASDTLVWDRALRGFGVRVYPSGAKVYVVQARGPNGHQTHHRGPPRGDRRGRRRGGAQVSSSPVCTPAMTRFQRPRSPPRQPPSPRWPSATCASMWRCTASAAPQPSTRLAIERYIVPALGSLPVSALGRTQVADLQHALSDRPAMANLVIATLSRMIDQAMAWGVAGEMTNPCRSAPKYRTRRRERFLTDAEFRRLGQTLDGLEATGTISPYAAAGIRLLMLTGCRRNEILTLRWEDVRLEAQELQTARLQDRPAHGLALA